MKIILSPAKKMKVDNDFLIPSSIPQYIHKTEILKDWLTSKSETELKALWKCNDELVKENIERLKHMDLKNSLTCALLSYVGIAYQYMASDVFTDEEFAYINEHLRILSAFYGVLRPMDGIVPYRLEMMTKGKVNDFKDLYDFWGRDLYDGVTDRSHVIINLASKEYYKCVEKYLTKEDKFITITFCEMVKGNLVTKGTYAKMARGEMVRFMAENNIEDPEKIKSFSRLGYAYRADLSDDGKFVFERKDMHEDHSDWE